jgi:putative lipoprotein
MRYRRQASPHRRPRPAIAAFVVAVFLPLTAPARAADPDPWFGRDKALHFGASATIAGVGYGATAAATESRPPRLLIGGGLALAAGVGKELLDATGSGDASFRDLTWDVVGTATGLGVAWLIDRLIFGAR